MTKTALSLDLADARRIIAAGERRAIEMGVPYNIAVVDGGGGLVAHVRMDGAWLGSVDSSINKAWTARAFDMSTDDLSHLTQSGQQGFGLNTTNHSRVVIFRRWNPDQARWRRNRGGRGERRDCRAGCGRCTGCQ